MSLFRKPTRKIQRRQFTLGDDDEDAGPEPPPPPVISKSKENKPVKSKTLLSFADEEEDDGEVFQVKKSSQSKRLIKKREKEKRKVTDTDSTSLEPSNGVEDKPQEEDITEIKAPSKPKKKVTLEGLILSGREALAADGTGDLSEEDAPQEEEEENEKGGFHQYRAESVRAALAAGGDGIPDAALIHAARKTRQQARELGGVDYIPVRPEPERSGPGSRLQQDDDGSGDDEEEGRMLVRGLDLPSDKPKRDTAATEAEMDSEAEEWEEQQMQKAMPAIVDITGDNGDVNPFAVAPAPPRLDDAPAHLRPLVAAGTEPPATAAQLLEALRTRLSELHTGREATAQKAQEIRDRLLQAARVRESRCARCGPLDAAYKRAQAARAYITDLVECLDEKMPELETLEARALALHRKRCELIQERRRADVRDQAQDVLALAARPGSVRPPDSEDKVRRAAEREGRRRARRLKREAGGLSSHRDGDSSDDELPPAAQQHRAAETEAIRRLSAALFADALPAYRSVRGVCRTLARWRREDPRLYSDAYVADCLPKLLAPLVRHQLILWNPLADEDNEDYERMDWYKCLMMFGVRPERASSDSEESGAEEAPGEGGGPVAVTEDSVREDPDLGLVPTIVQRVLMPKLTELIEHAWDPMCVRACVRLRGVFVRVSLLPPRAPPGLRHAAAAARARLVACVAADVFLPPLPPQIMETSGGVFWRRCLGAGVRLLRAALALCAPPDYLHADSVVLSLIGTLCTAAGAAPPTAAASAVAALTSTLPRGSELRKAALRRLSVLAQLALGKLQGDNPMHLKALEQVRAVLSEAQEY